MMYKIKAVDQKDAMSWRRQARRQDRDDFARWLPPEPPQNNNTSFMKTLPGLARTDKEGVLISQLGGQDNERFKAVDLYAQAYSDAVPVKKGEQFSFGFIHDLPLAAKMKVDEKV